MKGLAVQGLGVWGIAVPSSNANKITSNAGRDQGQQKTIGVTKKTSSKSENADQRFALDDHAC